MALLYADKELNAVGEDTWELFEAIEESFGVDLGDYYTLAGIGVGEPTQPERLGTVQPSPLFPQ
jgi:hypothetical protein